ncbi:MAG: DEAD/DEAH box helicase [Treponema sp.]|nr:DEAD/DEAH box helicase [Candidatus Treponema caballi]
MEEEISFEDLGLDEQTLEAVRAKGFETPSPIQILAIPRLLNGDANIIAKARTGTGKTAAFGLPLVQTIRKDKGYPQALILTPTRELCMQVCKEVESFTDGKFPRMAAVYGGASYATQIREMKRGLDIVVGTPGRIKDHIDRGTLDLSKISYFILDEADEMLDMGFIEDIEYIFAKANAESRVLLFSATMPQEILRIASSFMGDYEIVEEEAKPEEPILTEQHYWMVREYEKIEALVRLIDISPDFYGLVFTQTKVDADAVSKQLDERGYEAAALHGDIPQSQREKILARFRSGKTRILVATDVAARGIDIEGLSHVVNYSMPTDSYTYIHRIGRTGRAGASGLAYTFVRPEERRKLEYLKRASKKATKGDMMEDDIPEVEDVLAVKRTRIFDELKKGLGLTLADEAGKTAETALSATESAEEALVAEQAPAAGSLPEAKTADEAPDADKACAAALATPESPTLPKLPRLRKQYVQLAEELTENYPAEEMLARVLQLHFGKQLDGSRYGSIVKIRPRGRDGERAVGGRSGRSGNVRISDADFAGKDQVRLYVQMGRRDGFGAREISVWFSQLLHIPQRLVDRIDVAQDFCLVSLPANLARDVLERSQKDRSLPHMHVDVKESGGEGRDGMRDSRSGRGWRRDRNDRREDRFEKSARGEKKSKKSFNGRGVPGIERRSDEKTGNASLYKKKKEF